MAKPLSEAHIERQITDFLALDGWRALKTDPCSDKSRGKGFGEIGMADVLYIRYRDECPLADLLWVEHKRPGGSVTLAQKVWHRAERARGALVAVAIEDFLPSLDGFLEWYGAMGLTRRVDL